MHSSNNTDIIRYSGNNRIKLFVKGFSKELYFNMSTFVWNEVRLCNYETGLKFRLVKDPIAPGFFINYISGYNHSLLDYNKRIEAVRGGVILNY
jgi:outer membrane phospholipase A